MSLEELVANIQCEEAERQDVLERLVENGMIQEAESLSFPDYQGWWE